MSCDISNLRILNLFRFFLFLKTVTDAENFFYFLNLNFVTMVEFKPI